MMKPFYESRPDLLFVGDICDHPFPAHVHEVAEIVYLLEGELTMTIAGKTCRMRPGDIGVVFPSVAHSYDNVPPNAKGLALIFVPGTIQEYLNTFHTKRPVDPFLTQGRQRGRMDDTARMLYSLSQTRQTPLILAYLHVFLAYLFLNMPLIPVEKYVEYGMTHQVLQYVSEHFTEHLTLESAARALGISRSHLSHIFSQQLHVNFRQYINTLRIDKARFLLRDPQQSVTQIAYSCGYENPRTFHRAFLEECGMQPSAYRQEINRAGERSAE